MRLNKWNGSSWESVSTLPLDLCYGWPPAKSNSTFYDEIINNYLKSYKINSEKEKLI